MGARNDPKYGLHIDGLNAVKENESYKMLVDDSSKQFDLATSLENFINDENNLKGEAWKAVRIKMEKYRDIYNSRSTAASALSSAIDKAIKLLLDYLGDDIYLDPSELDEIIERKNQCEATLAELKSTINLKVEVPYTKEDGTIGYIIKDLYNEGQKAMMRAEIDRLETEVIPKLKNYITKIEGLEEINKKAELIIKDASTNIDLFKMEVDSIIPSEIVTFIP